MSWVSRRGFLKATGAVVGASVVVPSATPVVPENLGTLVFDGQGKAIGVVTGVDVAKDTVHIQVAGRTRIAVDLGHQLRKKCGYRE